MLVGKFGSWTAVLVLAVIALIGQLVFTSNSAGGDADLGNPGNGEASALPLQQIEYGSPVTCLTWSANGKVVATGTKDGIVRVIQAGTGKETGKLATGAGVDCLALSADDKTLVLHQPEPGNVTTWDVATGKALVQLKRLPLSMEQLACNADASTAIVAGHGQFMRFEFAGGRGGITAAIRFASSVGANAPVGFGAIAADANLVAWYDGANSLRVRYLAPVSNEDTLDIGKANAMAFGQDGKLLAVSGEDKVVRIWDLTTRKKMMELTGVDRSVVKLSFSANGKTVAARL